MKSGKSVTTNVYHGKNAVSVDSSVTTFSNSKFRSRRNTTSSTRIVNNVGEVIGERSISTSSASFTATSGIIGSTLSVILALLIIINLFNLLFDNTDYRGFMWFLEVISNAPAIPVDWLSTWTSLSIDAPSWGVFEFLANFLNLFSGLLSTIVFIGIGAVNIIIFVLYFVTSFLFLGI